MWQVWINNFVDRYANPVVGWAVASTHTTEVDADNQMQVYITSNSILPDDIKVVFSGGE